MFLKDPGIYFEVHGQGRPLVLLNGIMMNTVSWKEHLKRLAADYQVIIYDMRDQGQSDRLAPGYDISIHAEDLKKLLDHLAIKRSDFLGVSYGGMVVQIFTLRYPQMVDRLVLANTTAHMDQYLRSAGEMWKRAARLYDGEAFFDLALIPIYSRMFYNEQYDWLIARREIFKKALTREWFDGLIRLASSNTTYDIRQKIGSIKVQTLLISSDNDVLTPYTYMLDMHRQIPGSRFVCIPDAGHAVYLEKIDTFCMLIKGFLDEPK
jgi:3-oxoadipate enol-lactonase